MQTQNTPSSARLAGAALLVLSLLTGCGINDYDPTEGWSKEKLYAEAKAALEGGDFQEAIDYFETLEARYPFGDLALQAQLDIAYAYYQYGEEGSAISALDRFIKLHPTHEGVAYAYYMRGLIRYNRGRTFVNDIFPRDLSQMDQQRLRAAFADFRRVVERHPDSQYYGDARKRMVYLRNKMAEHEYETAQHYFRRSAYTAAINRIDYLLSNYKAAPVTADAVALQVRAYERMGIEELANDARRVLTRNWPDHEVPGDEPGATPQTSTAGTTDQPE